MNDLQQNSFASEANAIDLWLADYKNHDQIQNSNQLYQILKDLSQAKNENLIIFDQLNKLTPTAIDLVSELEQRLLNEAGFFDAKSRKLQRLGLHIIRELITLYHKTATRGTHDQSIFYASSQKALTLIGQHMLISAKIGERPSNIYWKITAQLYQKAKANEVQALPENGIESEQQLRSTIESQLKRNILFSICNPYQLSCSELEQLYNFLTENADMAELKEAQPRAIGKLCFVWEYPTASAPTVALPGKTYHPALLINTDRLGSFLQTSKTQLPVRVINAIQQRLSSYQKLIHSDIPSAPNVSRIFLGYEQIAIASQLQLRKNKIFEQGRTHLDSSNALIDAKLEPMAHENLFMNAFISDEQNSKSTKSQNNTIKLLKTQHLEFIIAVSTPEKQTLDSLVLIIDEKDKPLLGIIRRVLHVVQSNTQRILIELIPGEIDYLEKQEKDADYLGLLVLRSGKPAEVLLKPKSYTTGSVIQIKQHKLILEKLTEITPHFMRYQINPE